MNPGKAPTKADRPAPPVDPDRPNADRSPCHIRHADRLNGTHVLMEPHPTGERYIEIDAQEVWQLEDLE